MLQSSRRTTSIKHRQGATGSSVRVPDNIHCIVPKMASLVRAGAAGPRHSPLRRASRGIKRAATATAVRHGTPENGPIGRLAAVVRRPPPRTSPRSVECVRTGRDVGPLRGHFGAGGPELRVWASVRPDLIFEWVSKPPATAPQRILRSTPSAACTLAPRCRTAKLLPYSHRRQRLTTSEKPPETQPTTRAPNGSAPACSE
jgi:hypothetical protein